MSFLKAEWRKLVLANYLIDPKILERYVPARTELDFWEGRCYVSLVGFMFRNTRMLGLKIPFHVNFEEVNLRFYVRHHSEGEWKRGVVFIKEIVPKPALTFVANSLYREHYQTWPMTHSWEEQGDQRTVSYRWRFDKEWQEMEVNAALEKVPVDPGSEAEFITEHYWGYTKISPQKTFEYQVTHPRWDQYPVHSHHISVDFEQVYGKDFAILNQTEPLSVMLAEGSEITVESKKRI